VQNWRVIPHFELSGAIQMKIDRILLDQFTLKPNLLPTLRFYSWQPSAISLGLHQTKFPAHWQDLIQLHQLDLVRRPSGGRAVLHQGDLCYALIAIPPYPDRQRNYEYFCRFLINGLQKLGVAVAYGQRGSTYTDQPNCFAIATGADLVTRYIDKIDQTAKVCKLVGTAQAYRQGALLQHGSILLNPDQKLRQDFFGSDSSVVGLAEILGYSSSQLPELRQKLIANLTQAASEEFEVELLEMPLVRAELAEMGLDLDQF
jgi:lipoate---protein ligase